MAIEIRVKGKLEVNAYRNGVLTAKALRATELHAWRIGKLFSRFSSEDGSTATFFDIVGGDWPAVARIGATQGNSRNFESDCMTWWRLIVCATWVFAAIAFISAIMRAN